MSTIRMPQLGESVVEGTIGKWLVQEGQRVEKDQPVVEILTDKADSEINAPEAGVIAKTHRKQWINHRKSTGQLLGIIGSLVLEGVDPQVDVRR